jgi:hypothetical protein
MWCGVVWCGVVWCGVVQCGVVWCGGLIRNGPEQNKQVEESLSSMKCPDSITMATQSRPFGNVQM